MRGSAVPSSRWDSILSTVANRRRFLIGGSLATGSTLAAASLAQAASLPDVLAHVQRACCPIRIAVPTTWALRSAAEAAEGNQDAMGVASRSQAVMQAAEATMALATELPDPLIRAKTIEVLQDPSPTYQLKSPSLADRQAVRQELLAAGLIPEATTVDGIFPPVVDANQPPQAFWSAPGSTYAGHHSYPGGLAIHEWVNASLAIHYVEVYDMVYGLASDPGGLDPSIAMAAPLWHDIHKVVVFQWNPDGSEFAEQVIADTGAHHPLSGAEAIVRGMPPAFVIAQLSAHDAPTTSKFNVANADEASLTRLVNYIRAAAIIARVDPVAMDLLRYSNDGTFALAQDPPRIEGHINHLSDHDFIFSGDSAAILIRALGIIASDYGIDPAAQTARFNLFRNLVFSQVPDMRLYGVMLQGGMDAVRATIEGEVDLSQLRA
jgi:hypothetical protein